MKSFTKTATIILIAMMYMTSNAQSVIVKAGYNLSSLSLGEFGEDDSYSDEYGSYESTINQKMLSGYHISALVDFPISDRFSIETGVSFSTRGTEIEYHEMEIDIDPFTGQTDFYEYSSDETVKMTYLELPVTTKYRFPINDNVNICAQAGAYLGYALSGSYSYYDDFTDQNVQESFDWEEMNRFDAGATAGVGVEIGRLFIGTSYDLGLVSVDKLFNIFQNRNLKFSVGYTIASRK